MRGIMERLESLGDRLNPLLVREVRQSLRSNVFSGAVILTSIAATIAIICGISFQASNGGSHAAMEAGQGFFMAIFMVLWIVACISIPASASVRFRNERSTGEFELFAITGISPCRIINGKLQSALTQAFLIVSITAPFMVSCYLLRGVSIPGILVAVIVLLLISTAFTQFGILLGSMEISKGLHAILNIAFALGLVATTFGCVSIVSSFIIYDNLLTKSGADILAFTTLVLLVPAYATILFYLSAVAMLELPNKNKGFWLRTTVLSTSLSIPFILGTMKDYGEPTFYFLFMLPTCAAACFASMHNKPAPQSVRLRWKKSRFKVFRPLLYPGKGSFMVWLSILIAAIALSEYFLFPSNNYCAIAAIASALSAWILILSIPIRLAMPSAKPILVACTALVTPSVVAVIMAFTNYSDAAQLIFPFSIPVYLDYWKLWSQAFDTVIGWCIFLFLAGMILHKMQIEHEARLESERKEDATLQP